MRFINPEICDMINAIRGAALLADAQVAAAHRLPVDDVPVLVPEDAVAFMCKHPAGFVDFAGVGKAGDTVAAVSVAWYTRLNGAKVVQLLYGPTKVTRDGLAETLSLVPPEFIDQILVNGGFPVLASERLSMAFGSLLSAVKSGAKVPAEVTAVVEQPGDLNAWRALGETLPSADLLKAIGA
jgi:hypothetical protein